DDDTPGWNDDAPHRSERGRISHRDDPDRSGRHARIAPAGASCGAPRSAGGDPAVTSLLEARDIRKSFRNGEEVTEVLKGIDVTLDSGELVALMGPSGSGKSTLLSIIGLLLRPTSGQISIAGEHVDGL